MRFRTHGPGPSEPSAAQKAALLTEQLEIYEALDAALERRADVFQVIDSSESVDQARDALRDLLGISETGATAVLELQLRRIPGRERAKIAERCAEMRDELDRLGDTPRA